VPQTVPKLDVFYVIGVSSKPHENGFVLWNSRNLTAAMELLESSRTLPERTPGLIGEYG